MEQQHPIGDRDRAHPGGAELTGAGVNAIELAADRLRAVQAEEMQRGQVSTKPSEEWLAALDAVVGAYVEAGVERRRAGYAATAVLGYPGIGVADALDEVDGYQWRKPGPVGPGGGSAARSLEI